MQQLCHAAHKMEGGGNEKLLKIFLFQNSRSQTIRRAKWRKVEAIISIFLNVTMKTKSIFLRIVKR